LLSLDFSLDFKKVNFFMFFKTTSAGIVAGRKGKLRTLVKTQSANGYEVVSDGGVKETWCNFLIPMVDHN
jgi:hypothetical protein